MQTRNSIIREYANGTADGFLTDLVIAEERGIGPRLDSENALIDAYKKYVNDPLSIYSQPAA